MSNRASSPRGFHFSNPPDHSSRNASSDCSRGFTISTRDPFQTSRGTTGILLTCYVRSNVSGCDRRYSLISNAERMRREYGERPFGRVQVIKAIAPTIQRKPSEMERKALQSISDEGWLSRSRLNYADRQQCREGAENTCAKKQFARPHRPQDCTDTGKPQTTTHAHGSS